MFRLGEKQKLTVVKKVDFGVYLAPATQKDEKVSLERGTSEERVLLPA